MFTSAIHLVLPTFICLVQTHLWNLWVDEWAICVTKSPVLSPQDHETLRKRCFNFLLSRPLKRLAGILNWRLWLISLILSSSLRYAIYHPIRLKLHLITVFWYECMSRHLQYRKSRSNYSINMCNPYCIWGSHSGLTGDLSVRKRYTFSNCNYLILNTQYHHRGCGFSSLILLTAFLCTLLLLMALQLCEFWLVQQFSSILLCL